VRWGIGAAVLVGGRGERMFGFEKPLARARGRCIVERVVSALRKIGLRVVGVANPLNARLYEELELFDSVLVDKLCIGPLSGVLEALRLFSEVLAIGGDTVLLDTSRVEELLSECSSSMSVDVCCFRFRGFIEPLPAVYRKGFAEVAQSLIARGMYSLQRAIRSARALVIDLRELPWRDVDTFEDLRAIEEMTVL